MGEEEKGCDFFLPLPLLAPRFSAPRRHFHEELQFLSLLKTNMYKLKFDLHMKCLQLVGSFERARCLSVLEKGKCRPLLIRLVLIPTFKSLQAPCKEQSDGSVFFKRMREGLKTRNPFVVQVLSFDS